MIKTQSNTIELTTGHGMKPAFGEHVTDSRAIVRHNGDHFLTIDHENAVKNGSVVYKPEPAKHYIHAYHVVEDEVVDDIEAVNSEIVHCSNSELREWAERCIDDLADGAPSEDSEFVLRVKHKHEEDDVLNMGDEPGSNKGVPVGVVKESIDEAHHMCTRSIVHAITEWVDVKPGVAVISCYDVIEDDLNAERPDRAEWQLMISAGGNGTEMDFTHPANTKTGLGDFFSTTL